MSVPCLLYTSHYRYLDVSGILNGDRVTFDESALTGWDLAGVCQMFIVPLEDYNRLMGTSETLEPDQVLLYSTKSCLLYTSP